MGWRADEVEGVGEGSGSALVLLFVVDMSPLLLLLLPPLRSVSLPAERH